MLAGCLVIMAEVFGVSDVKLYFDLCPGPQPMNCEFQAANEYADQLYVLCTRKPHFWSRAVLVYDGLAYRVQDI